MEPPCGAQGDLSVSLHVDGKDEVAKRQACWMMKENLAGSFRGSTELEGVAPPGAIARATVPCVRAPRAGQRAEETTLPWRALSTSSTRQPGKQTTGPERFDSRRRRGEVVAREDT